MVTFHLALEMGYAICKMADIEVKSIFRDDKTELKWVCLLKSVNEMTLTAVTVHSLPVGRFP